MKLTEKDIKHEHKGLPAHKLAVQHLTTPLEDIGRSEYVEITHRGRTLVLKSRSGRLGLAASVEPGHARFHGGGGYPAQREAAAGTLELGKVYRVVGGVMCGWNTDLELEGVPGTWNSALFDVDIKSCPLDRNY